MKKRFLPIFLVAIMLVCTIISLTRNSAVHAATIPQSTILYGKNLNHTDTTKMYAEGLANHWKTGQSISTSDPKPYLDIKSYQKYAYASTDLANRDANYKNYKNLFQYIALDSSNAAIGSYANQFEALGYAYGSRLTWLNLVNLTNTSTEYKFTPVVANEDQKIEKIYIIPQYFDSNGNFTEEAPTWISASMNTTPTSTNSKQVAFILRYDSGDTAIGASNKCVIAFEDGYHNKLSGNPHYAGSGVNLNDFQYIYICYAPHQYKFDLNGGTTTISDGLKDVNRYGVNSVATTLINYEKSINKPGYTFTGWTVTNNDSSVTGTVIKSGDHVSFQTEQNAPSGTKSIYNYITSLDDNANAKFSNQLFSDCTFTATWKPNNYNINFNANGGSNTMSPLTVTYDAAYTLPKNAFTRTGYTFSKWNTNAGNTGTSYANQYTGTWKNDSNLTLYAQWAVNTARLDYRANGGSVSSSTYSLNSSGQILKTSGSNVYFQTVKYGTNAAPMTPSALGLSRTGYTFSKWRVHSTGTKLTAGTSYNPTTYAAYNDSSKTVANSTGINCVLWAEWTPNTYTVQYNSNKPSAAVNSVTGSTASSSHTYDSAKALTANGYSLAGYTFKGWNTKADGNGTSYTDKASVKNLTATNGGKITLYAQWEDNSGPTISDNYVEGNCDTEQTFDITISDIGSTIKSYTISGAGVEAVSGSLSGSNLTTNTITVKVKVKNAGTLTITATDGAGKTSSASKTFIKTYLNNNQGNITGNDKVATDNFSSIAGSVCHAYTLNTSGETVTPVSPSRKGCENIGWASSANATVGNDVIITNGGTYYVVWKDVYKPVVNASVQEIDGIWKLELNLYDVNNNIASINTGSDIAGYYLGSDPNYLNNTYYAVTCASDGSATGIIINIDPNNATALYAHAVDKAGNVSANTDAVTTFRRVTLATRIIDGTTSYAKFDYDGKNDLSIYTFYVLNGTKITLPEARRKGYHGTSDPNKSNISTTWTTEDRDDVIGITEVTITSDIVLYPTFVPNVYTVRYDVNMPKDSGTITTVNTEKLVATNNTGLYMSEFILTPLNEYVTYEGKDIATQFINDDTIPSDAVFNKMPKILSAKGWNFLGWYDDEAYTVTYDLTKMDNDVYESEAIKVYNNECKTSSELYWNEYGWINDSDVALYAHWMVNKYIINYNNNANDGSHCIIEHSNVTGELNTVAGENKQIALYDTYVELSSDNTLKKIAESKETNYLLGKEIGIIKDIQYVTVGQIQAWSLDANTKALEDEENVSKQIGASNAGKDTVYTNICKNLTDSKEVTVYAVWDHAPQFEKKSFYILSDDFNEFKEDDGFKYKEFSEHILNNVIVLDPEDGTPETIKTSDWKETFDKSIIEGKLSTELDTYVYTMDAKDNGKIILSFIDIEETVSQLLTFTTNASCQVKVDIVDTFGNVMHDQITIHFRSSDANEDIETGVNAPTLFTRTQFTRAINKKFFSNSFLDTTDWSNYKELGALRPTSVWINNPEYKNALETALHNLENNIYEASYSFTRDQVLATQMYTYGKIVYDEITERYNVITAERIKGLLNGRYTDEGHQITNINKDGKGSVNEVLGTYNELLREWGVK